MRTDADLQRDITTELRWDPVTHDAEIAVAVRDGVATLAGTVDSFAAATSAVRIAEHVGGVHVVANELVVEPPAAHRRTDTELAHDVLRALRADVQVPDGLHACVEQGRVTLEGEVDWDYQRRAAVHAVRNLAGVRAVDVAVTLAKRGAVREVSRHIRAALHRRADLDAHTIEVESLNGTIILRGSVCSWAERRDAERAAWNGPGVTRVENRLLVVV